MSKYSIGIDFGTLSARALLVDVSNGAELAHAVHEYKNAVIDERLPETDIQLPSGWALQDPNDYLQAIKHTIPAVLRQSGVSSGDVIGVGIDFTASTFLPTKLDGTPLCLMDEWKEYPHAWVKLWKHHAAQDEANWMTEIAHKNGYDFLKRYGGKVSSEWFFPKVWQILNEAPEVYGAADKIIEAGDWIVWQLTGEYKRNSCAAGYKAFWSKREGYPSEEFFNLVDSRMKNVVTEKMGEDVCSVGNRAGGLTDAAVKWTGLRTGTAVAVANVDAHVSVPAATVVDSERMVIIMGTSNCHMICGEIEQLVPGICGSVEDGILPGLFGFEAGQSCVGDHFMWFMENCVPESYEGEAKEKGISIYELLANRAAKLHPGQSGLLALDWWNGNRSILVDMELTGLIVGMTLSTKPEEIYRSLLEATAYGTRMILENFEEHGVIAKDIVAAGGLSKKNPLLMQIYADVTGREMKIAGTAQCSALGAAIMGAVAAGKESGGYGSIVEASQAMTRLSDKCYIPDPAAKKVYDELFAEYKILHDTFGRGGNDVMKRLKKISSKMR